jgi:hypothetical protein
MGNSGGGVNGDYGGGYGNGGSGGNGVGGGHDDTRGHVYGQGQGGTYRRPTDGTDIGTFLIVCCVQYIFLLNCGVCCFVLCLMKSISVIWFLHRWNLFLIMIYSVNK